MKQENKEQIAKAHDLLDDLKELRGGSVLPFHKKIANDPALIYAFTQQYINCNKKDTAIPRKYRELMIMILGCSRGAQTTINTHGRLAYEHGATIEEIGEALRLVFFLCGATSLIPAAELFEELAAKE
ncbi:MAG: hypothetical protein DELT_01025 [Desulfovibrio sp.]